MAAGIEPGGVRVGDGVVGRGLQHLVDGRRDAVQAAEQHDLAVEVVDLDGQAAGQALPRRRAGPGRRVDRDDPQDVAAPGAVLGAR